MYDLIILGGGPAGLTAAMYALRKRVKMLLITQDLGGKTNYRLQLPNIEHHLVINGEEIVSRFASELEYLDFARVMDKAEKVEVIEGGYNVRTHSGQDYRAKALIVATGARAQHLNVPGEKDYMMRGLCYSTISYAPLFIDHNVVVIGDSQLALRATAELSGIAKYVTLVAPTPGELESELGRRLRTTRNVTFLENHRVEAVQGDKYARTLALIPPSGQRIHLTADAFFVELGLIPNTELVKGLVALDAQGRIEIDSHNCTSAPGMFAAGDVTDAYAEQVLIAIGEGAKAALSAYEYLLSQPMTETHAEPEEWR